MDNEPLYYAIDPEQFKALQAVNKLLFEDRPLSDDQRRDLANLMYVMLKTAVPINPP